MRVVLIILSTLYYVSSIIQISLKQCEVSKACFKASKECTEDQCDFIVTWKPKKYQDKNYLEIEMTGTVLPTGGYIAIGFSEDKLMGDDGVLACYTSPGTSDFNIVAGFNEISSKNNKILINSRLDKDFLVKSGDKYGGNFNRDIKRISCRFLRLMTPEKNRDQLKDLSQGKKYYLLFAKGPDVNINGLNKHFPGSNVISHIPIDFTSGSYNTVIGSSKINSPIAKAHGILMIIAWITCCAIATFIARYYKDVWIRRPIKEGSWFNPHRGLQSCGFVLIIIALILIIIHIGGYSKLEDFPSKVHPILGFIVIILFVINPFIALCRCQIQHRNRPIFNWIHFFIGIIAYILSIPTIMIGLKLPGAGLALSQLNFPQWIVFIFVICQLILEIILEIHSCMTYRGNKDKRHKYELDQNEYERAIQHNLKPSDVPKHPRTKGRNFKLLILGFYITLCIVVTLALCIIIIVY